MNTYINRLLNGMIKIVLSCVVFNNQTAGKPAGFNINFSNKEY